MNFLQVGFQKASYFELGPATGDGSQCATMTARGARIAAAVAWFIQKAATAGVAAFATEVSNSRAVGR
jgi:hypothetical protein